MSESLLFKGWKILVIDSKENDISSGRRFENVIFSWDFDQKVSRKYDD